MQFYNRAAKSNHEKKIAKEQHYQKNNVDKNYHIATARPAYNDNLSKRSDRDER